MSRTQPTSTLVAAVGAVLPSTSSVEPPPMSATRYGGSGRRGRPRTAPVKDSDASSTPLTTSGRTPIRASTPSTKRSRFSASRDALVATNRTSVAPSSSITAA